MILQTPVEIINTNLIFAVLFLIMLLVLSIFSYYKIRIFTLHIIIFLFSIIIGIQSLSIPDFPLTPYFQLFFLVAQATIFVVYTLELFKD